MVFKVLMYLNGPLRRQEFCQEVSCISEITVRHHKELCERRNWKIKQDQREVKVKLKFPQSHSP